MASGGVDDFLALLCEGDTSTWDAEGWAFDSGDLTARRVSPAATMSQPNCNSKRRCSAGQGAAALPTASLPQPANGMLPAGCSGCSAGVAVSEFMQSPASLGVLDMERLAGHQPVVQLDTNLATSAPMVWPPVGDGGAAADQMSVHAQSNGSAREEDASNPEEGLPAVLPPGTIYYQSWEDLPPSEQQARKTKCCVLGCDEDVSELREFHQRYHICSTHIKAPYVVRGNRLERFCQQCARFHSVKEFDDMRRSCRVQLAKHNARRRKRTDGSKPLDSRSQAGAATSSAPDIAAPVLPAVMQQLNSAGRPGSLPADVEQRIQDAARSMKDAPGGAPADAFATLFDRPVSQPASQPSSAQWPAAEPPSVDVVQQLLQGLMMNPAQTLSLKRLLLSEDVPGTAQRVQPALQAATNHLCSQAPLPPSAPRSLRLSMKLLQCTPDDLPSDLKQQVVTWLNVAPECIEGTIRPGCVFLTLQVDVMQQQFVGIEARGVNALVQYLVAGPCDFWRRINMVVQLCNGLTICSMGRCIASIDITNPCYAAHLPYIARLSTHVAISDGVTPLVLTLEGSHLDHPDVAVVARCGTQQNLVKSARALRRAHSCGRNLNLLSCEHRDCRGEIQVTLDTQRLAARGGGLVWIEAQMGGFLAAAQPVLVLPSLELAANVQCVADSMTAQALLRPLHRSHWFACREALMLRVSKLVASADVRSLAARPPMLSAKGARGVVDGGAGKRADACAQCTAGSRFVRATQAGVHGCGVPQEWNADGSGVDMFGLPGTLCGPDMPLSELMQMISSQSDQQWGRDAGHVAAVL